MNALSLKKYPGTKEDGYNVQYQIGPTGPVKEIIVNASSPDSIRGILKLYFGPTARLVSARIAI